MFGYLASTGVREISLGFNVSVVLTAPLTAAVRIRPDNEQLLIRVLADVTAKPLGEGAL